jgi:hypothetical protein
MRIYRRYSSNYPNPNYPNPNSPKLTQTHPNPNLYNPIVILAACTRFVFYKIGYEKSTSIGMEDERDNKMAQSSSNSVGSSTHCAPSALFILGVYTVRISNIELHTVRAITNCTGSISSAVCQSIFSHMECTGTL